MLKSQRRLYSFAAIPLKRTPLHEFNVSQGGKMVDYAGFEMPVLYEGQTHIESHNWVRSHAGLFDVSHMLQHRFSGPGATKLLEKVSPADLQSQKPFTSTLSVLLNDEGGIVDDTIITKHGDEDYYVVTNAGCRDKDVRFFRKEAEKLGSGNLSHDIIPGALLALQGPQAAESLQKLTTFDLSTIKFGQSAFVGFGGYGGAKYHVARGGYTGEDGFEISITDEAVAPLFANKLVDNGVVKPIGLAARDSLRLEAGMCLYGHEIDELVSPVESALTWVIGKRRRTPEGGDFNGKDIILERIANKSPDDRVRVGFTIKGPAARQGIEVHSGGKQIGVVTSGSMSPTLGYNIGMAYVPRSFAKSGSTVQMKIRNRLRDATIVKLPFVKPNYFR